MDRPVLRCEGLVRQFGRYDSARGNLRSFGRLQGLGTKPDRRISEVLEAVGLVDRADDRVDDYSGGTQRRAKPSGHTRGDTPR